MAQQLCGTMENILSNSEHLNFGRLHAMLRKVVNKKKTCIFTSQKRKQLFIHLFSRIQVQVGQQNVLIFPNTIG